MSPIMNRLLLLVLLIYIVSAESCIIKDKKGKPDIRVIQLDDSSKGSSDSAEVVALHLPDRRRREAIDIDNRKASSYCRSDDDCGPGFVCLAHLTCVKGTGRTVDATTIN